MGERKVVNKYISPEDFDPAKLERRSRGNGVMGIRMMLPFTIVSNRSRSYTGRGTKFNMDKETVPNHDFLGIKLHSLYARCINCSSKFIFRTDPQNSGYVVETGARVSLNDMYSYSDDEIKDSTESKATRLKREMVEEADLELIKCVSSKKRPARDRETKVKRCSHYARTMKTMEIDY